jgi:hypothetical protein
MGPLEPGGGVREVLPQSITNYISTLPINPEDKIYLLTAIGLTTGRKSQRLFYEK